ncbi:MAG: cysteine--tRNA ligase [Firmicutes bacterium CAG:552_39_19]|nr:MAG: cysteine--tRNA ligase [Firmicutes bacterium CAG:552_39_19]
MLKVYNTLTRRKEEFVPLNDRVVTMYSCGPTVYSYAHIGNMRAYLFMDSVRRTLKYNGYKLKGVMNITDVGHLLSDGDDGEDKMEKASREQQKSVYEIAAIYTDAFMKDLAKLNIGKPEIIAKATDHINDMIKYVEALVEKGYGYETSDGIYFDISKFREYGKLSGLDLEGQRAGARVDVNDEKRNPADFALWKKAPKEHIMQWESPWGMGYPGWHIECSAMSRKYLGDTFDIHTGGVDHIPVHHENEIAQSEALVGHKTVDYWMHVEFMQVDGGKMSKSLKNTYTVSELEQKGYSAMAFRYFCLNTHYRKKLNFTFEGMDAAKTAYNRLLAAVHSHKGGKSFDEEAVKKYDELFTEAINDDINIPLGLGVLWNMLKEKPSQAIYDLAMKFDKVLGLALDTESAPEKVEAPEEVIKLAELRLKARKDKDWTQSDVLREQISKLGYQIIDKKDGYDIKKI